MKGHEAMTSKKRFKTFTFKGAAAGAYMAAQSGAPALTDDERALRVATIVHLYMQTDPKTAVALIKQVAKDGLAVAAKTCTAVSQ